MEIQALQDAQQQLTRITADIRRLGTSIYALRTQDALPSGAWAELRKTVGSLTSQLQPVAPYIAQVFDCEASLVKFVKVMFESVGYDPEIRDGGFFFPLFIEEDEMTWDEYFGEESGKQHSENVVTSPPPVSADTEDI